jgi:hypothetical protein
MRNYWLRILFGALAIFAVGMVGVTLARQGIGRVRNVVEGSGPITVPVAFLPFKLDGQKLGTIQRIRINRLAPKTVSSVNIVVRLADSVSPTRLQPCLLIAEGFEDINSRTTFKCGTPEDTVDEDLVTVGNITLVPHGQSFNLLMSRDAIRELTDSDVVIVGGDSGPFVLDKDSISRVGKMTDSIERMTDSVLEAKRPQLESLGVNLPHRPRGTRDAHRRMADSARAP